MKTMTTKVPFFCIDTDYEEDNFENNRIVLPDYTYTKTDTAKIISEYRNIVIDLIYRVLKNEELYKNGSINNKHVGEFMEKFYYSKRRISYNNTIFEFNVDFFYEIKKDIIEDLYIAQNEFFDIYGYGDTIHEAEQDLYNTLYELWKIYAEENDDNLDNKAKAIKKKLVTNIRKLN